MPRTLNRVQIVPNKKLKSIDAGLANVSVELKQSIASNEKTLKNLEADVKSAKAELSVVQKASSTLSKVQGELDSQNKELQSVIDSIGEHSQALVKKQKEFDTLHLDYIKEEKLHKGVCANLAEKMVMHKEVSSNLVSTTAECSTLQKTKASLEGEISSLQKELEKATVDFDSEIDVIGLQFVVKKTAMETELTGISQKKLELEKATKVATKKLSEMKIVITTEEANHKKEIDGMLDAKNKELSALQKEIAKTEKLQIKDQQKLEDMKQQHKKEEEKLQTIRKQTDEFKLGVVSEMAKMKVKKQLATIDTAGLTNALK